MRSLVINVELLAGSTAGTGDALASFTLKVSVGSAGVSAVVVVVHVASSACVATSAYTGAVGLAAGGAVYVLLACTRGGPRDGFVTLVGGGPLDVGRPVLFPECSPLV